MSSFKTCSGDCDSNTWYCKVPQPRCKHSLLPKGWSRVPTQRRPNTQPMRQENLRSPSFASAVRLDTDSVRKDWPGTVTTARNNILVNISLRHLPPTECLITPLVVTFNKILASLSITQHSQSGLRQQGHQMQGYEIIGVKQKSETKTLFSTPLARPLKCQCCCRSTCISGDNGFIYYFGQLR